MSHVLALHWYFFATRMRSAYTLLVWTGLLNFNWSERTSVVRASSMECVVVVVVVAAASVVWLSIYIYVICIQNEARVGFPLNASNCYLYNGHSPTLWHSNAIKAMHLLEWLPMDTCVLCSPRCRWHRILILLSHLSSLSTEFCLLLRSQTQEILNFIFFFFIIWCEWSPANSYIATLYSILWQI